MKYWQFKFDVEYWDDWNSPKTRGGKPNDIAVGDIVFLYRIDKKTIEDYISYQKL